MKKFGWLVAALAVVAVSGLALAQSEFIGASKCKMCHKVEYASWEGMAHANAFEQLEPEDQTNAECLKCHATGGTADLPGVQCESCHGAGSGYKGMKVMKDHDAAVAAGLIKPDEATCKSCHEGAPHDQEAFDYAAAKAGGEHEIKEK